jgi:KDO2-lipid IV(A) lauroyltransferase
MRASKPPWLIWLEYLPARLLLPVIRGLPFAFGSALGRATGQLLYLLLPTYRRVARINLELAFPGRYTGPELRRVVTRAYASLVQTCYEFVALTRLSPAAVARLTEQPEGYAEYKAAVARGRGVIACSIHLADWYWTVVCAAIEGHKIHVVIRPLDNPRLDALMRQSFDRWGIGVIPRRQVFPAAVAALRRGETVALMVDQNAAVGGRFVPFFGVPAATMRGVFHLRRGTGAAVVAVHDERHGDRHRAVLRELTQLAADENGCLAQINRYFETVVAAHPDQYLWLHPRWKTRPEGEPSLYPGLRI